jgi:translation initiation factor 3 subunit L
MSHSSFLVRHPCPCSPHTYHHHHPTDSEGPVDLQLPEQWLWDIIDEFIYQFQSFCVWRSKAKAKTEDELAMLSDSNQVWSSYSVLNVLYSLIQKSAVNEHLVAIQQGKSQEEIA